MPYNWPMRWSADDVRFWRDEDLGGLEVRYSSYDTACFARHTHDSYSVAVVERGRTEAYLDGCNVPVRAGDIVLVHPHEVHSCNPARGSGWRYWMLHLGESWFRALAHNVAGDEAGDPRFDRPVIQDAVLAREIVNLGRLVARRAGCLEREAAATETLAHLLTSHCSVLPGEASSRVRAPVRRAQEHIDAHLAENTSLTTLASVAGLSPYHLLRVFKASTRLPPHAWRNQRRIQRARRLLATGQAIADVALETGFTDQSHFSNRFKDAVGTTPRRYQRS